MWLPPMPKALQATAYRRKFDANVDENLFMGSYASFADAEKAAPRSKPVGYNHAGAVKLYSHQIAFYDYPGIFWLEKCMQQGMRSVFDLGGHVGIKYYAFRRIVNFPPDLRWTVCDVPAVVEAGRSLAVERGANQLTFTGDHSRASSYDVLFASGSLQYLKNGLSTLIGELSVKPKRVILNATAVHAEKTMYTLNSIGFAVCPYRLQKHDELLGDLNALGYRRLDAWRNEGKPITIPFVDGGDKAQYVGCCYELASA